MQQLENNETTTLPAEMWETIFNCDPRTNSLVAHWRVSEFWSYLLRNSIETAFWSLLPNFEGYLSRSDILRCSMVCKSWKKKISEIVSQTLEFSETGVEGYFLTSRLLPVLELPRASEEISHNLTSLTTEFDSFDKTTFLGKSVSATVSADSVHEDWLQFFERYGQGIRDIRLHITQRRSFLAIRRKCVDYVQFLPNVQRVEIFPKLVDTDVDYVIFKELIPLVHASPLPSQPFLLQSLKVLKIAKVEWRYSDHYCVTDPSSWLAQIFERSFPRLKHVKLSQYQHAEMYSGNKFQNVSELSSGYCCNFNDLHLFKLTKLTLNHGYGYHIQSSDTAMRQLSEITSLKETLTFLCMDYSEYYEKYMTLKRHVPTVFKDEDYVINFPKLNTLVVKDATLAVGFLALKLLTSLRRIHVFTTPHKSHHFLSRAEESNSLIWDALENLEVYTIQFGDEPRRYFSRELHEFNKIQKLNVNTEY